jgi:hypothetical protein
MNDWCIRYANRFYQIHEANRPLHKPKEKVVVRTRLDGTRQLLYREKPLAFTVLEAPPAKGGASRNRRLPREWGRRLAGPVACSGTASALMERGEPSGNPCSR